MTWFDVDPSLRKRVLAGEEAALRVYVETYLFRRHGITWTYTADSDKWYAVPAKKIVSAPPPCDLRAAAICAHEAAHAILGASCPNTGAHRERIGGRVSSCLECERICWALAHRMLPPVREVQAATRWGLGTYRERTPAPASARHEADRLMGDVSFCQRKQSAVKWEDLVARQEAARASAARDAEKAAAIRRRLARAARTARSKRRDPTTPTRR